MKATGCATVNPASLQHYQETLLINGQSDVCYDLPGTFQQSCSPSTQFLACIITKDSFILRCTRCTHNTILFPWFLRLKKKHWLVRVKFCQKLYNSESQNHRNTELRTLFSSGSSSFSSDSLCPWRRHWWKTK